MPVSRPLQRFLRAVPVCLMVALIALGCSSASTPTSTSPSSLDGGDAMTGIGPEGGSIEFGSIRLDFPPGAVERRTDVRIRLLPSSDPSYPATLGTETDVYAFEPAGLVFLAPVTATFTAPNLPIDGVVVWSKMEPQLGFDPLDTMRQNGFLSAQTTHFSWASVVTLKAIAALCNGRGAQLERCCFGSCHYPFVCGGDGFCAAVECRNPATDCWPPPAKPTVGDCQFAKECDVTGTKTTVTHGYECTADYRCEQSDTESTANCFRTDLPYNCCTKPGETQCGETCCRTPPPPFCAPTGPILVTSSAPFAACTGAPDPCLWHRTEEDCQAALPAKPPICSGPAETTTFVKSCAQNGGVAACDYVALKAACPAGDTCNAATGSCTPSIVGTWQGVFEIPSCRDPHTFWIYLVNPDGSLVVSYSSGSGGAGVTPIAGTYLNGTLQLFAPPGFSGVVGDTVVGSTIDGTVTLTPAQYPPDGLTYVAPLTKVSNQPNVPHVPPPNGTGCL